MTQKYTVNPLSSQNCVLAYLYIYIYICICLFFYFSQILQRCDCTQSQRELTDHFVTQCWSRSRIFFTACVSLFFTIIMNSVFFFKMKTIITISHVVIPLFLVQPATSPLCLSHSLDINHLVNIVSDTLYLVMITGCCC